LAAAVAAASESVAAWRAMVRVRTISPGVTDTAEVRWRFVNGVVSPVAGRVIALFIQSFSIALGAKLDVDFKFLSTFLVLG
jgi:hypothetical protein